MALSRLADKNPEWDEKMRQILVAPLLFRDDLWVMSPTSWLELACGCYLVRAYSHCAVCTRFGDIMLFAALGFAHEHQHSSHQLVPEAQP